MMREGKGRRGGEGEGGGGGGGGGEATCSIYIENKTPTKQEGRWENEKGQLTGLVTQYQVPPSWS